jgi:hypothetical protein
MITLTYGFKKPQTGDNGSVFFPALEDNITRVDGHTHNGTDSAPLPTSSLAVTTQAIVSGSWGPVTGVFRQLVTLPGGLQFDAVVVSFRDASSGNYYYLSVEKASATTYYVYINDNSINLTAYYGI